MNKLMRYFQADSILSLQIFKVFSFAILAVVFTLVLSGCGGSNNDDSSGGGATTTLSGTVATGAPFVGTLSITGSGGAQALNITIAADGSYNANVDGLTAPYMLQAIPTDPAQASLYSYAAATNVIANVTQLTTLAMFISNNNVELATYYAAWANGAAAFAQQALLSAQAVINANLAALYQSNGIDAATYDFFTTAFTADSTGIDAVLDDTAVSLTGGNIVVSVSGNAGFSFDTGIDVSNINIGSNSGISITVGSGLTPTYSWTGGDAMSVSVMRTSDPATLVWGITTPANDGISSPAIHGQVPAAAAQTATTEVVLTDGVEYRVSVVRITGGGSGFTDFTVAAVAPTTYTVGGTISGATSKFVLQNSNGDSLSATGTSFTFPTALTDGASYNAVVTTQPLNETCTVANGSGTISGADVNNVAVTCLATGGGATYTVSGAVSGITGSVSLELRKNGQLADDLPGFSGGNFSFSAAFNSGESYGVSISSQPAGQNCTVNNGSGSISSVDITDVAITCVDIRNPQSGSLSVNPTEYFDFSTGIASSSTTGADIQGTTNEGVNFGNETVPSIIVGRRVIRLATSGSLSTVPAVPVWSDAAPWVFVSWDFFNGTGGLPVAVGEIWAIYTSEGNYAVLQVTSLPGGNFGNSFTFDYLYNADGSRDF